MQADAQASEGAKGESSGKSKDKSGDAEVVDAEVVDEGDKK